MILTWSWRIYSRETYLMSLFQFVNTMGSVKLASGKVNDSTVVVEDVEVLLIFSQTSTWTSDVYKRWADFLYFKGEHNLAAEKYTQTIGYLEPSYVIHKLLDAQRIESLTLYLEQLQIRGVSRSEHRNLLISCYAKCKDELKLKELLEKSESTSAEGIGRFSFKWFVTIEYRNSDWCSTSLRLHWFGFCLCRKVWAARTGGKDTDGSHSRTSTSVKIFD